MEKVLDKKFDDLKVYIGSEMDRYLGLQREGFRDDLRIVVDSVVALTERVDKVELRLGKVEKTVNRLNDKFVGLEIKVLKHEKDIEKLKIKVA